jgi:phytoene synthase|tara:strand:+ start:328284 stop:329078 length:795 start_codon:yes stop_codon:yes gene_type:complete
MRKNHSQDIVSAHDQPRYTISLFAKTLEMKQALWALYAFNYEVAKTREIVSDTTLGLIRLTWWREALNMIYGKPTEQKRSLDDHPILPELADAIKTFALPYNLFDELLLGREFDLEDLQPDTLDGLITYIKNTNGPLLKLACLISNDDIAEDNLIALACANGLSGILHAIPFHAQHNIAMLPASHVNKDDIFSANLTTLTPCITDIAQSASELLSKMPRPSKGICRALYKLTQLELGHIKKCAFNVRDAKYQQKIPFLAFRIAL